MSRPWLFLGTSHANQRKHLVSNTYKTQLQPTKLGIPRRLDHAFHPYGNQRRPRLGTNPKQTRRSQKSPAFLWHTTDFKRVVVHFVLRTQKSHARLNRNRFAVVPDLRNFYKIQPSQCHSGIFTHSLPHLGRICHHSQRQYCLSKSINLNNLGVSICKKSRFPMPSKRLFMQMAGQSVPKLFAFKVGFR